MSNVRELVREARAAGRWDDLVAAIPYNRFIHFSIEDRGGELLGKLTFAPDLIGNPTVPALHGGAVAGLLESTAIFAVLRLAEPSPRPEEKPVALPKTITLTIDYLRPGRPMDTWARGTVTRHGRRVVNVRVEAWQEDPGKPIATANALFLLRSE